MCTGQVPLEFLGAQTAANAGNLLLTVQNVQLLYPLMVLCSLMTKLEILIVSAILRASVIDVHKGKVRVGFWVGKCEGWSSGNYDAYTGWRSVSRIFVEEVPKEQA